MVIWLIGLSGAGKTTIGAELVRQLRPQAANLVFVDGDAIREVWGDSPGHDVAGRQVNAGRASRLCAMLDSQGIHVIAAILSIFPEWQAWNRQHFSSYFEVFLDTPMDVLERRDHKGLYAAARRGEMKNVVGVDIPFPRPPRPDLILAPPAILEPPHAIVGRILSRLPAIP